MFVPVFNKGDIQMYRIYKLTVVKELKRSVALVFAVILCLFSAPSNMTVEASQPKVMVVDYQVVQKEIFAGQVFDLKVTIKNTGSRYVDNLKISVTSDTGDIVPAEGAGNGFIDELPNGEESTFTFRLRAADGLAEKSYKLSVVNEYDDVWGNPYSATDVIYLPVKLSQRASITDLYIADDAVLGDSVEIVGNVNNMGAGVLYNVRAKLQSTYMEEMETYIGNIDPGKSGSIDILTNAVATTPSSGDLSKVIVTYEDKEGNETTVESSFQIAVESPVYDNVEKIKDSTNENNKNVIYGIGAAVFVVMVCILWGIRKHRRKKAILDEF